MASLLRAISGRTPAAAAASRMAPSAAATRENVADYPRPPRLEPTSRHLRVLLGGEVVADTRRAYRVLETHHPPTYYIPPADCTAALLAPAPGGETTCEWKGRASYFDVVLPSGEAARRRVWAYPRPTEAFAPIAGFYSFYASPFECFVDGERVEAQPGNFYGGWKTSDVEGAIKGGPGTWGW